MTAFASAVAGAERLRRGLSASFDVFALAIRLYIAYVFFLSGLTKIRDWDSTLFLFTEEYHVPILPPELAAYVGTAGELCLPVLLVLGLAGRFGALGLFILNAVAVISYPGLAAAALKDHFLWGALLLVILLHGPGKLSADALIWPRLLAKTN
jgi:putative oxidoreductase